MNKYLVLASALVMATSVSAGQTTRVNAQVEDFYSVSTVSTPRTSTECNMVQVPVYGKDNSNDNAGANALFGMIIGGIIGKEISGDDGGAAAGAVLGGVIGADKGKNGKTIVVGYRLERQCSETTRYTERQITKYDYSVITWTMNGREYASSFIK